MKKIFDNGSTIKFMSDEEAKKDTNAYQSRLVKRLCPRCKITESWSLRVSLTCEKTHAKYAGVCSNCITKEEENEILFSQARALQMKAIDWYNKKPV